MADGARGLAPSCLIETAEGPIAMAETPNKGFAVMTRLPGGHLGFRQLIKVIRHGPVPLVRLVLDSGHSVVVAREHPVFRAGMMPVAVSALAPGDPLETAYSYPQGYAPPDATAALRGPAITVRAIEPAGEGEVMTGTVRDTHALFLTAGILCGE